MTVEELSFPSSTIWFDKKNSWLGVRDGKAGLRDGDGLGDGPERERVSAPAQQVWPRVFPGL